MRVCSDTEFNAFDDIMEQVVGHFTMQLFEQVQSQGLIIDNSLLTHGELIHISIDVIALTKHVAIIAGEDEFS